MSNRRHLNDRESRRFSKRNNSSTEDARRRFHDENYDNYFPIQNYSHPKPELARSSQYGIDSHQCWSPTTYEDDNSLLKKSFYGKGPKGYKRTDERIKDEASEALYCDPDVDASEIEVIVQDGEITLSGTVNNRQMKRLAEDCVAHAARVSDVRNELRVQSQSSRPKRATMEPEIL